MATLVESLNSLSARQREHLMLVTIGLMARGELPVADVPDEQDMRQMAYLASVSKNRVRFGANRLSACQQDPLRG